MNPLIIPIFLPHLGCRQHCLFCNQKVTVREIPSPSSVRKLIERALEHFPIHKMGRERQIAFYGGSFTAMDQETQVSYLKEVRPFISAGRIDSVRLSTRPDALNETTLAMLKGSGVKTVEIGAQSMVDEVLILSRRGHQAEDTASAILRLRDRDFEVGVHLMNGLPGDTCDYFMRSLDEIIDLRPDFVRIHPALVLKGAPLEVLWRSEKYSPLSLNQAVEWLKRGILKLEKGGIPIARIGLQPTEELEAHLLAGPYHPALHQLVDSAIFYDMAEYMLRNYLNGSQPALVCHSKDLSSLRGQKNENILKLKEKFGLQDIPVEGGEGVRKGSLFLKTSSEVFYMDRRELPVEGMAQDKFYEPDSYPDVNRGLEKACWRGIALNRLLLLD
jgi:histone acetyltransferase (RNA polymerase elongator complex component)